MGTMINSCDPEKGAAAVWLFGLPCAGKSTLAAALAARWRASGRVAKLLDGDELRTGLCRGLGFNEADRTENLRRAAEVARLFLLEDLPVAAAFITPQRAHRAMVRAILAPYPCLFVFAQCDVATCMSRDVKGLYARARRGEIRDMTGVSGGFEEPAGGESVVVDTRGNPVETCVAQIEEALEKARKFGFARETEPGMEPVD